MQGEIRARKNKYKPYIELEYIENTEKVNKYIDTGIAIAENITFKLIAGELKPLDGSISGLIGTKTSWLYCLLVWNNRRFKMGN